MLKWMQSQYRVSQWIFNFKVQNCILSGVQSVCSGNFATVHLALYFIFNYHIHTLEKITNVFWACNVVRLSKVICFSRCSRLTPKKENKQHASSNLILLLHLIFFFNDISFEHTFHCINLVHSFSGWDVSISICFDYNMHFWVWFYIPQLCSFSSTLQLTISFHGTHTFVEYLSSVRRVRLPTF